MRNKYLQKGVAAVELAILLPILILLCFGITEYGRAMYQYDTLTKSVRSSARYLTQYASGDSDALERAKNLAVFGQTGSSGTPLLPDLTIEMVNVSSQTVGSMDLVSVAITGYPFRSLVPGVVPDITFGPISATMRQTL